MLKELRLDYECNIIHWDWKYLSLVKLKEGLGSFIKIGLSLTVAV